MNQLDATMIYWSIRSIKSLLHLVGSSVLLYLIDDARSNKNQVNFIISLKHKSPHQIKLCKIKVNNDYLIVLKCSWIVLSYLDILDER